MTTRLPDPDKGRTLSEALAILEIKLARLEQRSHDREAALCARDEEITGLREIIKTLQAQHMSALEEIQRRGETLRAVRHGFENSTSWKVTRPLRWFMQRLRGKPDPMPPAHHEPEVAAAAWNTQAEPEPAPNNELQWLEWLDCARNDYGVWLRNFEHLSEVTESCSWRPAQYPTCDESNGQHVTVSFISVLAPGHLAGLDLASLGGVLSSLQAQTITEWEWLIVAHPAQGTIISDLFSGEPRIHILHEEAHRPFTNPASAALKVARGRHAVWLDTSFLLRPHALSHALAALKQHPEAQVLYADEDSLTDGVRHTPQFHADYNPDLWLAGDPLGRFVMLQTEAIREAGGFQEDPSLNNRYDLLLRMVERMQAPSRQVLHLPHILCHHLPQPAANGGRTPLASFCNVPNISTPESAQQVDALQKHLKRTGMGAIALSHPGLPGHCRVSFELPTPAPAVGIVIPTRDSVGVLSVCLSTLLERSTYPEFKVVVVDNGSSKPETLQYLQAITDPRVKVVRDDAPFNFSRVVNRGVAAVEGDVVCLLNNDMQITQPDWLEEMVGWAIQPGVAAVGARLWYGEGLLQHGGIILGIQGMAGHAHKFLKMGDPGYMNRAELHQTMSAVTGACMVVRRSVYEELGGFDEALGVAYNDVDFCLRARKAGYRNVWTPFAEMIHHESISRGFEDSPEKQARFQREASLMRERWADWLADDPAYNPNLTLEHEDFGLAWPPRKRQS